LVWEGRKGQGKEGKKGGEWGGRIREREGRRGRGKERVER
jgi:hypothetical protein